jgi:hypothetical protein
MSGGNRCRCKELDEPITAPAGSNRPGRLWRCTQYKCNHSAFNGYHYTGSDYSAIICLRCGASWRTRAGYAGELLAGQPFDIMPGVAGYEGAMANAGRTPFRGSSLIGDRDAS